jgi:hypothetical protein
MACYTDCRARAIKHRHTMGVPKDIPQCNPGLHTGACCWFRFRAPPARRSQAGNVMLPCPVSGIPGLLAVQLGTEWATPCRAKECCQRSGAVPCPPTCLTWRSPRARHVRRSACGAPSSGPHHSRASHGHRWPIPASPAPPARPQVCRGLDDVLVGLRPGTPLGADRAL